MSMCRPETSDDSIAQQKRALNLALRVEIPKEVVEVSARGQSLRPDPGIWTLAPSGVGVPRFSWL